MSDARVGRARRGVVALAVTLLLGISSVGLGLLVGAAAVGRTTVAGAPPKPVAVPAASAAPAPGAAPTSLLRAFEHMTGADLRALTLGFFKSDGWLVDSVPLSVWDERAKQVDANLTADGCWSCAGQTIGYGFFPVATLCLIGGILSAGLICVGALAAVGLAAAIAYFFGSEAGGQALAGTAAKGLAQKFINDTSALATVQANAIWELAATFNLTRNALAYEAASAALGQLGNGSFNVPQDLVASRVAQQAGTIGWEDQTELSQIVGSLYNSFTFYEGTSNTLGQYCNVYVGTTNLGGSSQTPPIQSPDDASAHGEACPTTLPSSLDFPWGTFFTVWEYQPTATSTSPVTCSGEPMYLTTGDVMLADSPAHSNWTAQFENQQTFKWTNVSVPSHGLEFNFTGGAGAYTYCVPTVGVTDGAIFPQFSFPLSSAAESAALTANGAGVQYWISNGASGDLYGAGSADLLNGCYVTGSPAIDEMSIYNDGPASATGCAAHGAGIQENLVKDLWGPVSYAGTIATAYWAFLRGQGYTSASQVPSNCIIPTPDAAIPPNVPVSQLTTANATQVEQLYITYLDGLARTFNSSVSGANLSSFQFCGKHVTLNSASFAMPFGTYAYGYLYNPNSTKNQTGATQVYGTPATWNLSGVFWLGPSLAPEKITLNSTWLLPEHNPNVAYFTPFTKVTAVGGQVKITGNGPTACLSPTVVAKGYCNTTLFLTVPIGWLVGNSTNLNGSAYPPAGDSTFGAGFAVYLTACFVANAASFAAAPTYYSQPSACQFNVSLISSYIGGIGCGSTVTLNCGGGGPILVGATACGQTIPIWASVVTAVASVTGTSALGCLVAEIVAGLLLFAISIVVAYGIIYAAVHRPGRTKPS